MATEWDNLFNASFLFQKLVKYNFVKLIIEALLIILMIWVVFIIFIITCVITIYIFGHWNSNKLVLCAACVAVTKLPGVVNK